MNLLALIKPAFTVLNQGQSLTNVETWKNAQALTNLGIAIGAIMAAFIPGLEIPADVVGNIAVAIAGVANWYFTLATSEKVGLPPIELQAQSEPESQHETTCRPIPEYRAPTDARWVYTPKVQSKSSSAPEAESVGFGDKN